VASSCTSMLTLMVPGTPCSAPSTSPRACAAYKCEWLKGSFEEKDRPDKSGLVVNLVDPRISPIQDALYNAFACKLLPDQALPDLLTRIAKQDLITLGVKIYGPKVFPLLVV
jgi:hypothetical protein